MADQDKDIDKSKEDDMLKTSAKSVSSTDDTLTTKPNKSHSSKDRKQSLDESASDKGGNQSTSSKESIRFAREKKDNSGKIIFASVVGCILVVCCCSLMLGGFIGYAAYMGNKDQQSLDDPQNDISSDSVKITDLGKNKEVGTLTYSISSIRKEGRTLIINMTVKNDSKYGVYFSSTSYMSLINDDTNRKFFKEYTYSPPPDNNIEGYIPGGSSRKGEIGFNVSDTSAKNLTLVLKSGLVGSEQVTYDITIE